MGVGAVFMFSASCQFYCFLIPPILRRPQRISYLPGAATGKTDDWLDLSAERRQREGKWREKEGEGEREREREREGGQWTDRRDIE